MGMPSISITFTELAATAIKRGERGTIAMILKDTVPTTNPAVITSESEIPEGLTAFNKNQISLALIGYIKAPLKVIAYVLPTTAENYTAALNYFKTVKFDYLVVPTVETDEQDTAIVSYINTERAAGKLIKAVLPNKLADRYGVINYATANAIAGDVTYTTEQYCSRIAGLLAGTPLNISATYAPLAELTDCTRLTKAEMDAAVNAGKFIIWYDGEKVKTGRAVNSLTTLTSTQNAQFQKIKIIDTIDMIADDIRMTIEDNYIGKYPNSYDNKCLLISAIGNYLQQLVNESILEGFEIGIDIDKNAEYLSLHGVDTEGMSDDEIKRANTGSHVYLKAKLSILDAIEDIDLPITI